MIKEENKKEIINRVVDGILKIEKDAANQIEEISKSAMISKLSNCFEEVMAEYED